MTQYDVLINMVIARAPALREAGVLSLTLDGLSVMLAPSAPPKERISVDDEDEPTEQSHPDPLMDPATYAGGFVPTFDRSDTDDVPDQ